MLALRPRPQTFRILQSLPSTRSLSTLPNNPHIYHFPDPSTPKSHLLTYLPTTPPNPHLAIGTSTTIPPTPGTFTENPHFLQVLDAVLAEYATKDPDVITQAKVYASPGGSNLGTGGAFFPQQSQQSKRQRRGMTSTSGSGGGGGAQGDGAGAGASQGGMGGANRGGWIHVSDGRNPPDWGRIAWPEDILGSVEVDGNGEFVGPRGNWQKSGTYRVLTPEGMLGISGYLRGKVVERLREIEKDMK